MEFCYILHDSRLSHVILIEGLLYSLSECTIILCHIN